MDPKSACLCPPFSLGVRGGTRRPRPEAWAGRAPLLWAFAHVQTEGSLACCSHQCAPTLWGPVMGALPPGSCPRRSSCPRRGLPLSNCERGRASPRGPRLHAWPPGQTRDPRLVVFGSGEQPGQKEQNREQTGVLGSGEPRRWRRWTVSVHFTDRGGFGGSVSFPWKTKFRVWLSPAKKGAVGRGADDKCDSAGVLGALQVFALNAPPAASRAPWEARARGGRPRSAWGAGLPGRRCNLVTFHPPFVPRFPQPVPATPRRDRSTPVPLGAVTAKPRCLVAQRSDDDASLLT